jgi:uncharacterized protein YkwD
LLAFLLGTGAVTVHPAIRLMASSASGPGNPGQSAPQATLKPASAKAPDIPFHEYEFQAEQDLLQLANHSRHQAGVSPLKLDSGLSEAARAHAVAMMDAQKLSHQFAGESALPQSLALTTNLQLDQEGENVALDHDAEHGHEHLMLSPPHRANLLNPAYNVVGLGVVRSGDRLYIVQDFGHALPNYSVDEVKDRLASAMNQQRRHAGEPALARQDSAAVDEAACSMAQADRLGTTPVQRLAKQSTVVTYTSLRPETLPGDAARAITSRNLHSFSVGACYARTETYPTGVYWIVLALN